MLWNFVETIAYVSADAIAAFWCCDLWQSISVVVAVHYCWLCLPGAVSSSADRGTCGCKLS